MFGGRSPDELDHPSPWTVAHACRYSGQFGTGVRRNRGTRLSHQRGRWSAPFISVNAIASARPTRTEQAGWALAATGAGRGQSRASPAPTSSGRLTPAATRLPPEVSSRSLVPAPVRTPGSNPLHPTPFAPGGDVPHSLSLAHRSCLSRPSDEGAGRASLRLREPPPTLRGTRCQGPSAASGLYSGEEGRQGVEMLLRTSGEAAPHAFRRPAQPVASLAVVLADRPAPQRSSPVPQRQKALTRGP